MAGEVVASHELRSRNVIRGIGTRTWLGPFPMLRPREREASAEKQATMADEWQDW